MKKLVHEEILKTKPSIDEVKKKKKITPIKRKPIKVDVRKVKSKRGNARNNIKAGLKKERVPNGETIIQVINEQIEVTRKTKKVSSTCSFIF